MRGVLAPGSAGQVGSQACLCLFPWCWTIARLAPQQQPQRWLTRCASLVARPEGAAEARSLALGPCTVIHRLSWALGLPNPLTCCPAAMQTERAFQRQLSVQRG